MTSHVERAWGQRGWTQDTIAHQDTSQVLRLSTGFPYKVLSLSTKPEVHHCTPAVQMLRPVVAEGTLHPPSDYPAAAHGTQAVAAVLAGDAVSC
jgi:hypothetical protein